GAVERLQASSVSVTRSLHVLDAASEATRLIVDLETSVRGFVITREDSFLQPHAEAREQLPGRLRGLRELVAGRPEQISRLDRVEALLEEWQRVADEEIRLARSGGEAGSIFSSVEGKRRIDGIRREMRSFEVDEERLLTSRSLEDARARGLIPVVFAAAFLTALAATVLSFLVGRQIVRPVHELSAASERIAAGDLSVRLTTGGTNELARLREAFNAMAVGLQDARTQTQSQTEALHRSEERLRRVFDTVAEGIVVMDRDGRLVLVNSSAERLLGLERTLITDRPLVALPWRQLTLDGAPLPEEEHPFAIARRRGAPVFDVTFMIERSDGVRRVISANAAPLYDATGAFAGAVSSFNDVTEQRLAAAELERQYREAELARSESRAVLDAASEGMILIGSDRRILAVNRRFEELFAIAAAEMLGRSFWDFQAHIDRVYADPAGLERKVAGSADDRERRFSVALQQVWPQRRDLEMYSTPVQSARGEYIGRLYVFRDVSREREADRMKTEFVSLVSHELRTPLTSIKGYVDLMLDEEVGPLTDEQMEFLGIVKANADRLVSLISDLLDVSRIEAGRVELHLESFPPGSVLEAVATSMRPQIDSKRQNLMLQIPDRLPRVTADPDRVTQIVTNLLSNASKYTPAGGTVTVSAEAEGDWVRIAVADTGVGLTAEDQARLFEKFFRASNRATQEEKGTGLGLAIVKSLVQLHGGEITMTSEPGTGSTFAFTLPVVAEPSTWDGANTAQHRRQ
ncbi:MAG: CHASE3 domain-containing protein, partial [Chloroflexi bacterium]|nr:CHASE3 domain-containing protein [Chloroflexota bacterium]